MWWQQMRGLGVRESVLEIQVSVARSSDVVLAVVFIAHTHTQIYTRARVCADSAFEAGPSLLPPKKYSDVSGLEAAYTDPRTGLRYASVAELKVIRTMSPAQVEQMLQLRGAGQSVG